MKGNLRMYLEKITLDLEEEKNEGCNWDAENNIRMNCGQRQGSICVRHRLAEGTGPCKLDQNNADPKGNLYRLVRKKIEQPIVHGSQC